MNEIPTTQRLLRLLEAPSKSAAKAIAAIILSTGFFMFSQGMSLMDGPIQSVSLFGVIAATATVVLAAAAKVLFSKLKHPVFVGFMTVVASLCAISIAHAFVPGVAPILATWLVTMFFSFCALL
jgi:apolipoprotein N-acyltransferase